MATTVTRGAVTFGPDRAASDAEQLAYELETGHPTPERQAELAAWLRFTAHGLRMCAREIDVLRRPAATRP